MAHVEQIHKSILYVSDNAPKRFEHDAKTCEVLHARLSRVGLDMYGGQRVTHSVDRHFSSSMPCGTAYGWVGTEFASLFRY